MPELLLGWLSYGSFFLVFAASFAIIALGLNLQWGFTGLFNVGVAGFVAVLIGFTSSVAVIFQAAQALSAMPAQTASWLWALGIGMGVTSIILSLVYRLPILIAWSTPGAAVIASAAAGGHLTMPQAVGAFLACDSKFSHPCRRVVAPMSPATWPGPS